MSKEKNNYAPLTLKQMKLNTLINKIHLYTGLQASIALLIFSTLVILMYFENHQEPSISHYQFKGKINHKKNIKLAKAVHLQIGLKFEAVPEKWMLSESRQNILLLNTKSPTAKREIRLNKTNGDIEVTTWPLSFAEFINHMHQEHLGRRRMTDNLWLWAWSVYIELSLIAIFILPFTGLYIWISGRSIKKHWAKLSIASSFITTVILWNLMR